MPVHERWKAPFKADSNYHIIFKSIDGLILFYEEQDYFVFKKRWLEFLQPFFFNLAYNQMQNHVHLIVKTNTTENVETAIKDIAETKRTVAMQKLFEDITNEIYFDEMIKRQCNRFMVSYANYIANKYKRKGGLFQKNFKRIEIHDESHLQHAIIYVNANAQKHKVVNDFKLYRYCSYWETINNNNIFINPEIVIELFGGSDQFQKVQNNQVNYFY